MIEFVLSVLICTEATSCTWQDRGTFVNERVCRELGRARLATDRSAVRFKCVVVAREATPDEQNRQP